MESLNVSCKQLYHIITAAVAVIRHPPAGPEAELWGPHKPAGASFHPGEHVFVFQRGARHKTQISWPVAGQLELETPIWIQTSCSTQTIKMQDFCQSSTCQVFADHLSEHWFYYRAAAESGVCSSFTLPPSAAELANPSLLKSTSILCISCFHWSTSESCCRWKQDWNSLIGWDKDLTFFTGALNHRHRQRNKMNSVCLQQLCVLQINSTLSQISFFPFLYSKT